MMFDSGESSPVHMVFPSSPDRPRVLRATAQNRVVVSYALAPERVAPLLPEGLVPDRRDGAAYVSLVGGELRSVRILGLPGVGVRRVPIVELRVHVRRGSGSSDERGTWALRVHVPRRLVAWGGRLLYGEEMRVTSMQPIRRNVEGGVEVTYRFDWQGREQRVRVRGTPSAPSADPDALARTLVDPTWRYGGGRDGSLFRARVERSSGALYRVEEHHVTVQWSAVYGRKVGPLLRDRAPARVLLLGDTPVALRWRKRG